MLNELIKKGLVKRDKAWYKLVIGEETIVLGNTEIKANEKLSQLKSEGKLPAPSTIEPVKAETSITEQSPEKEEDLDKEAMPKDKNKLDEFLGLVKSISTSETGRNTTIFIDGIKSTLTNHPVIKNCPLHFRWRKKENNVINGKGLVNRGYVVVSKKVLEGSSIHLTVSRDDTPDQDFYSVGDSVLCCTDKKGFDKRKAELVLKGIAKPKKQKEQRNEFAKQQAKIKDVGTVVDNYSNVNSGDNQVKKNNLELSDDYDKMIEQAKEAASQSDVADF